jgi:hypothetical protein
MTKAVRSLRKRAEEALNSPHLADRVADSMMDLQKEMLTAAAKTVCRRCARYGRPEVMHGGKWVHVAKLHGRKVACTASEIYDLLLPM